MKINAYLSNQIPKQPYFLFTQGKASYLLTLYRLQNISKLVSYLTKVLEFVFFKFFLFVFVFILLIRELYSKKKNSVVYVSHVE